MRRSCGGIFNSQYEIFDLARFAFHMTRGKAVCEVWDENEIHIQHLPTSLFLHLSLSHTPQDSPSPTLNPPSIAPITSTKPNPSPVSFPPQDSPPRILRFSPLPQPPFHDLEIKKFSLPALAHPSFSARVVTKKYHFAKSCSVALSIALTINLA